MTNTRAEDRECDHQKIYCELHALTRNQGETATTTALADAPFREFVMTLVNQEVIGIRR
jgi:hypothetical protein